MNVFHRWLCSSKVWKKTLEKHVLPWALADVNLGSNVLEVGPGYGASTEILRKRVAQLTCVEVDARLAQNLSRRQRGSNIRIVCEDATAMSFPDASFDGAVCFTMLHHVPSVALQDRLLSEVARVLRPDAMFAGTDSRESRPFRLLHVFDTLVVVDPATFPDRLRAAGFDDVQVDVNRSAFRFRARKRKSL